MSMDAATPCRNVSEKKEQLPFDSKSHIVSTYQRRARSGRICHPAGEKSAPAAALVECDTRVDRSRGARSSFVRSSRQNWTNGRQQTFHFDRLVAGLAQPIRAGVMRARAASTSPSRSKSPHPRVDVGRIPIDCVYKQFNARYACCAVALEFLVNFAA